MKSIVKTWWIDAGRKRIKIMRISIFYVLLAVLLFFSCSEKTVNRVVPLVEYDSVSVRIDYPILPGYSKLTPFVKNENVYALGYNHHIHSLDFVNFSGGDNLVVELQREGADAVLPPVSFCVAKDCIVWEDARGVVLLTLDGKVIKRMPSDEKESYLMKPLGVTNAALVNLHHDSEFVYVPLTSAEMNGAVSIGKVLDLKSHEWSLLSLKYPQEIAEVAKSLGGLAFPSITGHGNRILYNFPCSSLVYCYDSDSGEMTKINMKSCTIENCVDVEEFNTMSSRKKFESESTSARFDGVYYSSSLGKYYRVHYGKKERLFDKTRDTYLMLYDEEDGTSVEYLLPKHFSEQYMVVDDVVYFMCTNEDESLFKYARVDLKRL